MWRDAVLVAGKDLRIELRSRVVLNQVAPFAIVVLALFAFALGPDRAPMVQAAAGLFWVAVLFAAVLAVQRSFALEANGRDARRAAALGPRPGRASSWARRRPWPPQLIVARGAAHRRGRAALRRPRAFVRRSLVAACVAGTVGLAAVGTLYGALAAGLRVRETLLPFLLLPVVAPVLLAGTRAWQAALGTAPARRPRPGKPWLSAPARLRRRLPGPRRHGLRAPAGGVVNVPAPPGRSMTVRVIGVLALVTVGFTVWLGLQMNVSVSR